MTNSEILDRLFNLKSIDSIRIKEVEQRQTRISENRDFSEKEIEELNTSINSLDKLLEEITLEGGDLNEYLDGVKRASYATVLDVLNLSFEPDLLRERLVNELPKEIEKTENDIKTKKERLDEATKELSNLEEELKGIEIDLDRENTNQQELNEMIEECLNDGESFGNRSYNEIKKILAAVDFNEDEQNFLAREMFNPQDVIIPYADSIKDREGKNIATVIGEARENADEVPETTFTIVENSEIQITTEQVENFLEEMFLDIRKFSVEQLEKLRINFNEKSIYDNIEYVRNKDINEKMFYEFPMLLVDRELTSKIDIILIDMRKKSTDMYISQVLADYSLGELVAIKEECPLLSIDFSWIPLWIFTKKNLLENFLENIRFLKDNNVHIEDLLSKSTLKVAVNSLSNTKKTYYIMTIYGLNNNLSSLSLFAENPNTVANLFDLLIENNSEALSLEHPELINRSAKATIDIIMKNKLNTQELNEALVNMSGNREAVNYLRNLYNDNKIDYRDISADEIAEWAYGLFEQRKGVYNIDGISISKNKYLRNVMELIKVRSNLNLTNEQIKFISAMWATSTNNEDIEKIATSFGVKSEKIFGGGSL